MRSDPHLLLLVAATSAGAAAWIAQAGSGAARRLELLAPASRGRVDRVPWTTAAQERARLVPVVLAGLVGSAGVLAGPAAAAAAALVAAALVREVAATARRSLEDADRAEHLLVCEVLAAELRAGRAPVAALRAAADATSGRGGSTARRAAGVAELGGDVAAALRTGSRLDRAGAPLSGGSTGGQVAPGSARDDVVLSRLAACWSVSARSGAGLAAAVDRLAEGLRAQEEQRGELATELAGARATARLLALLPVLGLLLGVAVGVRPVAFLLDTPAGAACLLGAVLLDLAGVAWTERIVTGALTAAR